MHSNYLDYDVSSFYSDIEDITSYVNKLFEANNSLADNRNQHREYANKLNIDFDIIETAYKLYKPTCIIKFYTFTETLTKTYVYALLGDEQTDAVKNLIDITIPKERFSPGSKIKDLQTCIRRYTPNSNKFKLLINMYASKEKVNKFDNLIVSRHTYAHRDQFPGEIDIDTYNECINVLYYLVDELYFCLIDMGKRVDFQNNLIDIHNSLNDIMNDEDFTNRKKYNNIFRKIKRKVNECLGILKQVKLSPEFSIYTDIINDFNLLCSIDLRRRISDNNKYIEGNLKFINKIKD